MIDYDDDIKVDWDSMPNVIKKLHQKMIKLKEEGNELFEIAKEDMEITSRQYSELLEPEQYILLRHWLGFYD